MFLCRRCRTGRRRRRDGTLIRGEHPARDATTTRREGAATPVVPHWVGPRAPPEPRPCAPGASPTVQGEPCSLGGSAAGRRRDIAPHPAGVARPRYPRPSQFPLVGAEHRGGDVIVTCVTT